MAGGGLIITRHKSWNPGSRAARARVANDEAAEAERRRDEGERRLEADAAARLEKLRRRAGKRGTAKQFDESGNEPGHARIGGRRRERGGDGHKRGRDESAPEVEQGDPYGDRRSAKRALGREPTRDELRHAESFRRDSALGGRARERQRPWYALPREPDSVRAAGVGTGSGGAAPTGHYEREQARELRREGVWSPEPPAPTRAPPAGGPLTGIARLRAERLAREEAERGKAQRVLARGGR